MMFVRVTMVKFVCAGDETAKTPKTPRMSQVVFTLKRFNATPPQSSIPKWFWQRKFSSPCARGVGFHRQVSPAHSAFIRFRRDEPPSPLFGNLISRQFLRAFAAVDQK